MLLLVRDVPNVGAQCQACEAVIILVQVALSQWISASLSDPIAS